MPNELLKRIADVIEYDIPPYKLKYEGEKIFLIQDKKNLFATYDRTATGVIAAEDSLNELQRMWVARKVVETIRDAFQDTPYTAWRKCIDVILKE